MDTIVLYVQAEPNKPFASDLRNFGLNARAVGEFLVKIRFEGSKEEFELQWGPAFSSRKEAENAV